MRHLSDELIQQYLDTPELTEKSTIKNHLLVCFECQEKLEQYQELYQHLSVESEIIPDESFNLRVLAAVERIESKNRARQLVSFSGALSGLLLLFFSMSYFGFISWQALWSAVQSASGKIVSPFSNSIGLLVEKLNGNLELLVFAGLALLLFQLLDYSLIRHKTNRI